jgi:hypothetical protein
VRSGYIAYVCQIKVKQCAVRSPGLRYGYDFYPGSCGEATGRVQHAEPLKLRQALLFALKSRARHLLPQQAFYIPNGVSRRCRTLFWGAQGRAVCERLALNLVGSAPSHCLTLTESFAGRRLSWSGGCQALCKC